MRGSGQGLGYQTLLADLWLNVPLRVWTDSSAAFGICQSQGLGTARNLETQILWIQQAVRTSKVDSRKVTGEFNPADLLTKILSLADAQGHFGRVCVRFFQTPAHP